MITEILSYIKNIVSAAQELALPVKIVFGLLFLLLLIQTIRLHRDRSSLRSDAIKRSRSVIGGQLAEQVAPFLPGFPCNPGDVRFVGKPVDFVAFSGLTEKGRIDEIVLIEVKTGESALNEREKEVRKAVQEGRVRYEQWKWKE